jgi:predicted O-methyltransferase YrrM
MLHPLKQITKNCLRALGLTVQRRDRLAEYIPPGHSRSPYLPRVTRWSLGRICYLEDMLRRVAHVPGDVVECGVSVGYSLLYLTLLTELAGQDRHLYAFDSFQGFPSPAPADRRTDGAFSIQKGDYAAPPELVRRVLHDGQVSPRWAAERVHLVPGFFEQTLPRYTGTIALLHLDCDLFTSYQTCLTELYPRLAPGGVILLDEYNDPNFPGAARAIDTFFADKAECLEEYQRYGYRKFFVTRACPSPAFEEAAAWPGHSSV